MNNKRIVNYICSALITIILLLLLKVTDTIIEACQLVLMTYIVIGTIDLVIYLIKCTIRKTR